MRFVQEQWKITVQISHIEGLHAGSARHNDGLPERSRNRFSNLILLCKEHHDIVDSKANEKTYTADVLRAWKSNVEGSHADDLDELDWLSEDKLESLMADAITKTRTTLLVAIEKVHDVGTDTLEILKSLVAESFSRPYLDPGTIESLEYSAGVLEQLPAHAELLYTSSNLLRNLPNSTELLSMSSYRLQDLDGMVDRLNAAAHRLEEFQEHLPWLTNIADKLPTSNEISMLAEASSRLDGHQVGQIVDQLEWTRSSVNALGGRTFDIASVDTTSDFSQWSWHSFRWGLGVALILIVGVLTLFALGVLQAPIVIRSR